MEFKRGKEMGGRAWVVYVFVGLLSAGVVNGRVIDFDFPGYAVERLPAINISSMEGGFGLGEGVLLKAMVPYYLEELVHLLEMEPRLIAEGLLDQVESEQCKGHIQQWILRAMKLFGQAETLTEKDVWMLHMFDAWGKPPEGLLEGHVNAMGDFDECVEIAVKDLEILPSSDSNWISNLDKSFEGRYCNSYFSPYIPDYYDHYFDGPKIQFPQNFTNHFEGKAVSPGRLIELIGLQMGVMIQPSMAVCFPNTCGQPDIERVMVNAFNLMYEILVGGIDKVPKESLLWPNVAICYVAKKPDLDAGDISVIVLLCVLVGLCVLASVVDISLNRGLEKPPVRGAAYQYLSSFSLYTNIPRWLSTRKSADDLGCLHGIRVLSTSWVVLAHTWYVITFVPYWNSVDVKLLQEDWTILTILNSTISVDTFFVLSGLLVSYNVLKMLHKTKGKLNVPMFYIHRYLRLTPVYAVLVGVMATILPYLGRGPFWFWMDRWANICENNWWTNMLYVNNFVNTSFLCQGEAWYLANDMQFYIVSPIFLYPLYRWEIFGVILLLVATVASTLTPALMVHFLDTVPTTIGTRDVREWFLDIYIKPYARIQTYFIGMWLGWILFKTKGKRVRLPIPVVILFWLISTGACLAVLYGIYPWFDPTHEIPKLAGAMYAGLNRLAWAVSVSWIIFACVKGYGGIVNDFLSWSAFMPLGRVCYCVFLVSLHLQMMLHVQQKQPAGYSDYNMVNYFFGHMVMAFFVGFFFTLTVETPFMQIEKLIFEGPKKSGGAAQPRNPAVSGLPPGVTGQSVKRNGIFYNSTDSIINGDGKDKEDKEN